MVITLLILILIAILAPNLAAALIKLAFYAAAIAVTVGVVGLIGIALFG